MPDQASLTALILGTPAPTLARLIWAWLGAGHRISAVVTTVPSGGRDWKGDRRAGCWRPGWSAGAAIRRHRLALVTVTGAEVSTAGRLAPLVGASDVVISAGFMRRVGQQLLDLAPGRFLNLHPALLPAYRGALALPRMIADRQTGTCGGVTLHVMDADYDTGPVIDREPVPLQTGGDVFAWELTLARATARLACRAVPAYLAGRIPAVSQDRLPPPPEGAGLAPATRALTGQMTAADILWRAETFGRLQDLVIGTGQARVLAVGPARIIGPPTGAGVARGLLTVRFDAADARVALWRRFSGVGRWRRIRRLLARLRTPYEP